VVSIVCGAAMIFFVLPRISSGYLSKLASRSGFSSGFSDEVTLGDIGRIQQLDTLVMHVQFAEGSRIPLNLKWRGIALNILTASIGAIGRGTRRGIWPHIPKQMGGSICKLSAFDP